MELPLSIFHRRHRKWNSPLTPALSHRMREGDVRPPLRAAARYVRRSCETPFIRR